MDHYHKHLHRQKQTDRILKITGLIAIGVLIALVVVEVM